jgi:hypothetical protein
MHNNNPYIDYYLHQAGSGISVYGGVENQKGHGLGSILGSLFRSATPLLKSIGKKVGKQVLHSGLQVADDVLSGSNLKQSLKRRAKEGAISLIHQKGSGINEDDEDLESSEEEGYKYKRRIITPVIRRKKVKRNRRERVLTSDIFS